MRPANATAGLQAARPAPQAGGFAQDLRRAFATRPRSISPKWFYDDAGSALFDRICELPEYYPTRTELGILRQHAADMARQVGPGAEIIEFGAGSCAKVRLLLDALESPRRYRPVDISAGHLAQAAAGLRRDYPSLDVQPLAADYTRRMLLPAPEAGVRRAGFFPGSTLGNFSPAGALRFLRTAAQVLRGGGLLLGVDMVKDPAVLHAAYNDAQGVTAAFNLNLLARANREAGCDFDLDAFAHSAFYNAPHQRIEMHLASRRRQELQVCGQRHRMEEGETLHTENSHKYTVDGLRRLARQAGFQPGAVWQDAQGWFSVHWLQAPD